MFQPAGDFIQDAAKKFGLAPQAQSIDILTQVKQIIQNQYPEMTQNWHPQKFQNNTLTIAVKDAASSATLFMHSQELKNIIQQKNPQLSIKEIVIGRK